MAGKLFIVGGGMDAHYERIFSAFVEAAGGKNAKIAMVVSASGDEPDDTFRKYQKDLIRLGAKEAILIPLYGNEFVDERGYNALTGDEPALFPLFEGVTGVWFTGGDQYYTAGCFLNKDGSFTRALKLIHEIYQNGGAIGGTSAGAAIMSRAMIGFGNARGVISRDAVFGYDTYDALADEDDDSTEPLLLTQGLGFFPYGVVDQHFNKRPRLLRLIEACLRNGENARVGFGISEDTALVFDNGEITVLGAAGVYIVDCRNAEKTGAGSYKDVIFHTLHEGDSCDAALKTLRLLKDARREEAHYRTPDWVGGLTPDSPAFSALLRDNLLYVRESCLPIERQKNKPFCKGLAAYDCGGITYAVQLTYCIGESIKAYEAKTGLSFTDVELDVETVPLTEIRY
ncbi:MAG TPA: cyanophycinase [Clostridia bacterium]|nr:cyanophycinase [Clostridia bacterium]